MMKVRELIELLMKENPEHEVRIALQETVLNDQSEPTDHDNLRDYHIDMVSEGPDTVGKVPTVAIYATDSYYDDDGHQMDAEQWHSQNPNWQSDVVDVARRRLQKLEAAAKVMTGTTDKQSLLEATSKLNKR